MRGRLISRLVYIYQALGTCAIIILVLVMGVRKKDLIHDIREEKDEVSASEIKSIDFTPFYIYILFFLTIIVALIIFKVLDKRHKINIKMPT